MHFFAKLFDRRAAAFLIPDLIMSSKEGTTAFAQKLAGHPLSQINFSNYFPQLLPSLRDFYDTAWLMKI